MIRGEWGGGGGGGGIALSFPHSSICLKLLLFGLLLCICTFSLARAGNSNFPVTDMSTPAALLNGASVPMTDAGMSTTDEDAPFMWYMSLFALFWQIIAPFILVFGYFGNVMIIVICRRADVMSSLSVYFVTLAGSDLLSLGVNVFSQWVYYAFHVDLMTLHTLACKLVGWLIYVSGVLSAWTLVAMTAQRAVCVLWPHRAHILCSARNSKAIALSMTLFIAVLHCHLLYGLNIVIFIHDTQETHSNTRTFNDSTHSANSAVLTFSNGEDTTNNTGACLLVSEYVGFFYSVWSWFDLLIFSVLPWLCLVVSNSVLLWTLNVSIRQAQHSLGSAHIDGVSGRKKQASSMTVTLFAASTAFIVLSLPLSCVQLLGFYHHMVGSMDNYHQSKVIAYSYVIGMALWQSNSAVNFYLYCLTGSKFRRELKRMFSCSTVGSNTRAAVPSSDGTSCPN